MVTINHDLIVNIGHRNYGYVRLDYQWKQQLEHYLDNVSDKYEGELVDANKHLAKSLLSGNTDWKKYAKIALKTAAVVLAFLTLETDTIYAAPDVGIDISPIKTFSMGIWWTMFKAFSYLSVPIIGWAGYILLFAGANTGKRTSAKLILIGVITGLLFLGSAPWASHQLEVLVTKVFAKYI
jgi:hypothetical protein